jgi:hypothetical protein
MRVAGHGLGNCFFTYFHAVNLAEKYGATIVAPPWFSLKLGPLLRGESSRRLYFRMFRPFSGEIHGVRKLITLLGSYRQRAVLKVGEAREPVVVRGALNWVVSSKFTFSGLHARREAIRMRILGTINHPVPSNHRWGDGGYIAVHIRLGDFAEASGQVLVNGSKPNLRIPLTWYLNVICALRKQHPLMPVYLFSEGEATALRPLIEQGARLFRTGSDMTDLLTMSGASFLVGSNSTYSRWAAFLGDMPSIWLQTTQETEKPTAPNTPILYVPLDAVEPPLWS